MADYNLNPSTQIPNTASPSGLQYNFGADVSSLAATLDVTPQELNTALNVLQGIMNLAGTGAGSGLLPSQQGGVTVPAPTNVKAVNLGAVAGATKLAVTWNDAVDPPGATVDHYNVYAQNIVASAGSQQPQQVAATPKSPAIFTVTPSGANAMQVFVQTVLTNGYLLPLTQAPSATVIASNPNTPPAALNGSLFITNLTLTNNSPSAGDISWSACQVFYNGNEYNISSGSTADQFVAWTVGNSSFTGLTNNQWQAAINIFLIATNTVGVADTAWNKIASAGVTHDMINMPRTLSGSNGTLQMDGITWTDNSPIAGSVAWSTGHITYQGQTYTVTSGNTGSNAVVYWQLASPTSFQLFLGPSVPTGLGPNDFIVAINDLGFFMVIVDPHDNRDNISILLPTGVGTYNGNGEPSGFLGTQIGNTSSSGGVLRVFDGGGHTSANITFELSASDGFKLGSFTGQNVVIAPGFATLTFKDGVLIAHT